MTADEIQTQTRTKQGDAETDALDTLPGDAVLELLDVLSVFARTLSSDYDVDDILDQLVGRMPDILPIDGAGVMMEDDEGTLRFRAASDQTVGEIEGLQIELGEGPCLAAYQTGEQVLLDDLSTHSRLTEFAPRAIEAGIRSVYSFPMWHDGHGLGALNLYRGSNPGGMTPTQIATGQTLADVATMYVLNARRQKQAQLDSDEIRQLAATDPLTGLANRRTLMEHLDRALARSARSGRTVTVLYIDLDDFKVINDRFGHTGGDHALTEVAIRLRHAVRPSDMPARIGGDEFAVVCDEFGSPHEVATLAERILAALREPIQIADTTVTITPSIGVSTSTGTDGDTNALMTSADAAMYRAKKSGRNRIMLSEF